MSLWRSQIGVTAGNTKNRVFDDEDDDWDTEPVEIDEKETRFGNPSVSKNTITDLTALREGVVKQNIVQHDTISPAAVNEKKKSSDGVQTANATTIKSSFDMSKSTINNNAKPFVPKSQASTVQISAESEKKVTDNNDIVKSTDVIKDVKAKFSVGSIASRFNQPSHINEFPSQQKNKPQSKWDKPKSASQQPVNTSSSNKVAATDSEPVVEEQVKEMTENLSQVNIGEEEKDQQQQQQGQHHDEVQTQEYDYDAQDSYQDNVQHEEAYYGDENQKQDEQQDNQQQDNQQHYDDGVETYPEEQQEYHDDQQEQDYAQQYATQDGYSQEQYENPEGVEEGYQNYDDNIPESEGNTNQEYYNETQDVGEEFAQEEAVDYQPQQPDASYEVQEAYEDREQGQQQEEYTEEEEECIVVALYDYEAIDDTEINLIPGEYVYNVTVVDEGWWQGYDTEGKCGMFPANYVEIYNYEAAAATQE